MSTEKTYIHVRVALDTPAKLSARAREIGLTYGDGGATGDYLNLVANAQMTQTEDCIVLIFKKPV